MKVDPNELDNMLHEAIESLPVIVTIDGQNYHCTITDIDEQSRLMYGGAHDGYSFTIHARKRDFNTLPKQHSLVTIEGVEYEIKSISTGPQDPGVAFEMGAKP